MFIELFYTEKPIVTLNIPSQSQSVTYGHTITLDATVISIPKASCIEWKKNANTIQSDGRKFIIDKSNESQPTLTILRLDFDDSGNYAIFVTNALGSTEKEICIKVKGILKIMTSSLQSIHFQTFWSKICTCF